MKNKEVIQSKLYDILSKCKKIDFNHVLKEEQKSVFKDVDLYIMDDEVRNEVMLLEASVKGMGMVGKDDTKPYKGKEFFEFAKIINIDYPAYKYSFYVARKPVEIFDRDKVKERIEGERDRWRNMEKARLEKEISEYDPPLDTKSAQKLRDDLEERLLIDEKKIKEVLENWEEYDAVITTHAHCKTYPAIYYTLDTSSDYTGNNEEEKSKYYKKKDTHLRSSAPNLLWFKDERPFSSLRANDKISRIIQTYTPYCGTIYVKKRK